MRITNGQIEYIVYWRWPQSRNSTTYILEQTYAYDYMCWLKRFPSVCLLTTHPGQQGEKAMMHALHGALVVSAEKRAPKAYHFLAPVESGDSATFPSSPPSTYHSPPSSSRTWKKTAGKPVCVFCWYFLKQDPCMYTRIPPIYTLIW